jgi:hypothetical protein
MSNLFDFSVKTVSVICLLKKQKSNQFGFITQYHLRIILFPGYLCLDCENSVRDVAAIIQIKQFLQHY